LFEPIEVGDPSPKGGGIVRDHGRMGLVGKATPYEGLLLVSFGGPESPDQVLPFLERVTAGRGVSRSRLLEVAEHYYRFGGRSPINDQNRALVAAVESDFAAAGLALGVYWGNRNSEPFLRDTVAKMAADGITRAAAFITSAYSSYSGCRQYRENLADAVTATADAGFVAPRVDRLRHYFNHPGFITANADALLGAFGRLDPAAADRARVVFVTHSIPVAMAEHSGPEGGAYVAQHQAAGEAVIAQAGPALSRSPDWDLAYCSRSGPPHVPWLEPDINDHLETLAADGIDCVVLAPVGFVSDHLEVAYDLDIEAMATAQRLNLTAVRAATAGTHPAFVATVRSVLVERAAIERGESVQRTVVGRLPASHDVCPAGCCPSPRGIRPALGGSDSPVMSR
jgi:protoporphyrin/coproporphyrin ferrochelatase